MQDALTTCTAAKAATNAGYVACQNRLIDLQLANETSGSAASESRTLLDDCEAQLQDALARLMPRA